MKLKMIALVATLAATTSVTATIQPGSTEIGRASCRERVCLAV